MPVKKTHVRLEAIAFRQRGFTYGEIAKLLKVSPATVCSWLKDEPFSAKVTAENRQRAIKENTKRLRLLNKAKQTAKKREIGRLKVAAIREYRHFRVSPVFIGGLAVYQALGDCHISRGTIRLSTHRTDAQKLFHRFLLEFLGVPKEKVKVWLLLAGDLDPEAAKSYWQDHLKLSKEQFYKTQLLPSLSKKPLQFGVLNTIIADTLAKEKLLTWIEILNKES